MYEMGEVANKYETKRLETTELLGGLLGRLVLGDLEDVETNSLGERSALADGDSVTDLDTESGRNVGGNVLVALLVSRVLGDVVKVLSANDDGTSHLGGDNLAGQDTAADGNKTGPRALLVCSVCREAMSKRRCKGVSNLAQGVFVVAFASTNQHLVAHNPSSVQVECLPVEDDNSSSSESSLVGSMAVKGAA